ncbi:hypothetical protein Dda_5739 [Drechslerella dactyloides]|uniref:Uncharacterized protein n=1 Tax=Drechslerella dactyloides TaxID=74499 RepID=A0AAD6IVQ8_DREDA|nr:hypothetical protein Dda_5739 [Drechslerella dactyloides]
MYTVPAAGDDASTERARSGRSWLDCRLEGADSGSSRDGTGPLDGVGISNPSTGALCGRLGRTQHARGRPLLHARQEGDITVRVRDITESGEEMDDLQ